MTNKNMCIWALMLLLVGGTLATDSGYLCYNYLTKTDKFYNLNGLQTDDPEKYKITGQTIQTSSGPVVGDFLFNLCGIKDNVNGCPNGKQSIGFFIFPGGCYAISNNHNGDQKTSWSYGPIDDMTDSPDGIVVSGTTDSANIPFNISLTFFCDSNANDDPVFSVSQAADNRVTIKVNSAKACGQEFLGPFASLSHYKWLFVFVGAIIGLVLCFMGIRVFKYSLAILGFIVGFCVPFILVSLAWKDVERDNKGYIIFGISLVLGCMASYFVYSMRTVGLFIAGAFLGVVIGLEAYVLGMYKLEKSGSTLVLYLTITLLALIIGALAIWLRNYLLIFTTGVGGAWLAVKCVGAGIGNYPNEFTLTKQFEYGKINEALFVYLGIELILAVAGIFYQCKMLKEMKDIEDIEAEYGYKKA